jgi:hypothetical protein
VIEIGWSFFLAVSLDPVFHREITDGKPRILFYACALKPKPQLSISAQAINSAPANPLLKQLTPSSTL